MLDNAIESDRGVDQLRDSIARGAAIIVTGAGVTIQLTGRRDLGWFDLVRRSLDRVKELQREPVTGWYDRKVFDLALYMKENYLKGMLLVADEARNSLVGADGEVSEFSKWLQDEFSELKPREKALADAIASLKIPVLTTNYDDVLDRCMGYNSVTQEKPEQFQAIITGQDPQSVGHIHGVWNDEDSVVFDAHDYQEVARAEGTGTVHRSSFIVKTFIYVGFGDGLDDPNFESVQKFANMTFGGQGRIRHYRLCRDEELLSLISKQAGSAISPISYGKDYDDLPGFLENLHVQTGSSPSVSLSRARRVTQDQLSDDILEGSVIASLGSKKTGADCLLPPILLRVPPEARLDPVNSKRSRLKRIEPEEILSYRDPIIYVGDSGDGITSALQWTLLHRTEQDGSLPLYFRFSELNNNKKNLQKLVSREAARLGAISNINEPLSDTDLAIDEVRDGANTYRLIHAIKDIADNKFHSVTLGCNRSEESWIKSAFAKAGVPLRVVYLGRMNTRDIKELARRMAPDDGDELVTRAIEFVRNEQLPRTYYTFSLLFYLMLTNSEISSASSQTFLADAYVSELLTHGDIQGTSYADLDAFNRGHILETFAEKLTRDHDDDVSEEDFCSWLSQYFENKAWEYEARQVMMSLVDLKLLRIREGRVSFSRSSFAHMFAAKRAVADRKFLSYLEEDPVLFSKALAHYAAISRNDANLLRLLSDHVEKDMPEAGAGFICSETADLPSLVSLTDDEVSSNDNVSDSDLDRTERAESESGLASGGFSARSGEAGSVARDTVGPDLLEQVPDNDLGTGWDRGDDSRDIFWYLSLVELACAVLRDTELVEDLNLKEQCLQSLHNGTAAAIRGLDVNPDFRNLLEDVERQLGGASDMTDHETEISADFFRYLPAFIGISIQIADLRTGKLRLIALEAAKSIFQGDDPVAMGLALLFCQGIGCEGWGVHLESLVRYWRVPFVSRVLLSLLFSDYCSGNIRSDRDSKCARDFIVSVQLKGQDVNDRAQMQYAKSKINQIIETTKRSYEKRASLTDSA